MNYKENQIVVLTEDDVLPAIPKGSMLQVSRILGSEIVWFVTNSGATLFCNCSRIRPATHAEEFIYKINYHRTKQVIMKPTQKEDERSEK